MNTPFLVLTVPKLLSIKNSLFHPKNKTDDRGRTVILTSFAASVLVLIYWGIRWFLQQVVENPELSSLPPAQPLSILFSMLFFMLMISNVVNFLGLFFLSDDLDLILATPVQPFRFFLGRFCTAVILCSWMPALFLVPSLLAFGFHYHASLLFYSNAALFSCFFFSTVSSLSFLIAFTIALVIPMRRIKVVRIIALLALLSLLYDGLKILHSALQTNPAPTQLIKAVHSLGTPRLWWLPSRWISDSLGALLRAEVTSFSYTQFALLISTCFFFLTLSFLLFQLFHSRLFSLARNTRSAKKMQRSPLDTAISLVYPLAKRPAKALMVKEVKILFRDLASLMEVCMIGGIASLYLYNIRIFSSLNETPLHSLNWWKNFLFTVNLAMIAFISIALCARFVFPSFSREGKSFWILQTSPQSIKEQIQIKEAFWFPLLGTVMVVLFSFSAFTLGLETKMVILSSLSMLSLAQGIVSLAVGLSARFARFDWEHPSELIAGIGSFTFMLSAVLLVLLNILPLVLVLFLLPQWYVDDTVVRELIFCGAVSVTAFVNLQLSKFTKELGRKHLELAAR